MVVLDMSMDGWMDGRYAGVRGLGTLNCMSITRWWWIARFTDGKILPHHYEPEISLMMNRVYKRREHGFNDTGPWRIMNDEVVI